MTSFLKQTSPFVLWLPFTSRTFAVSLIPSFSCNFHLLLNYLLFISPISLIRCPLENLSSFIVLSSFLHNSWQSGLIVLFLTPFYHSALNLLQSSFHCHSTAPFRVRNELTESEYYSVALTQSIARSRGPLQRLWTSCSLYHLTLDATYWNSPPLDPMTAH